MAERRQTNGGGSIRAASGQGLRVRFRSWSATLVGMVCSAILMLLHRSWKTDIDGLEHLEAQLQSRNKSAAIFWHGQYVPLFALFRGRNALVLTSRSWRGEVIARICESCGYACRSIPGTQGRHGLWAIGRVLAQSELVALAADGPCGPYHEVKRGLVRLASELQLSILPISLTAHPAVVLSRRWDRLTIPLPFAHVRLRIGRPLMLPGRMNKQTIECWRSDLRAAIDGISPPEKL